MKLARWELSKASSVLAFCSLFPFQVHTCSACFLRSQINTSSQILGKHAVSQRENQRCGRERRTNKGIQISGNPEQTFLNLEAPQRVRRLACALSFQLSEHSDRQQLLDFTPALTALKSFQGEDWSKPCYLTPQDFGARRKGVQKHQGDPEMPRLSDLVMILGDLFREQKASCSVMPGSQEGSQPCLAGGQKVLLRRVRQSTAQVPECYHQQRGRGSAHTVALQASLSKAPWPLHAWLPKPCVPPGAGP